MYKYIIVDSNIVTSIQYSGSKVYSDKLILVESEYVELGYIYDGGTGKFSEPVKPEPITLTVTLDKYQCKIGGTVNYTIDFSENITIPDVVPISVTDRQGKHITNIGCKITDGKATGSFSMSVAGDFTVTNESINFHKISIDTELKIANEFWLRVYQ